LTDEHGRSAQDSATKKEQACGCPVAPSFAAVEGRLWGIVVAGARREQPLPADSEARLGSFTELVVTAGTNA
jgi:hypothetical protein